MRTEIRQSIHYTGSSEHGRSTVDIECAFYGHVTKAFIWSLSASGKKCQGACKDTIHYRMGHKSHKRDCKIQD